MRTEHGATVRQLLRLPPEQTIPGCSIVPAKSVRAIPRLWRSYQRAWAKCGLDVDEFESVALAAICVYADRTYKPTKGAAPSTYATSCARFKILERMKQEVGQHGGDNQAERLAFLRRHVGLSAAHRVSTRTSDASERYEHVLSRVRAVDPCGSHTAVLIERAVEGRPFSGIGAARGYSYQRAGQVYAQTISNLLAAFPRRSDLTGDE